ncbi:MAG: RIP metalloprotease RseP [Patescibacteria group bacterium]|nr:RIP metalloprotease RseP [Patescibacteria group bacterium]
MILTIVTFFIVLGILVLVHEAGHFMVARKNGVKVDEFGLGLPPRIFGFYRDEDKKWKLVGMKSKSTINTIWSLNWIPLGGFVKIKGEDGGETSDPDSFVNKNVWRRIWVVSAGVTMNILLAIVLLSINFTVGSPQLIDGPLPSGARVSQEQIRIVEVLPASPAATAGIKSADTIISIDGNAYQNIEDLQKYIESKVSENMAVKLERGSSEVNVSVVPEILKETNRGGMGVSLVKTALVSYPWYVAWVYGTRQVFVMMGTIIYGLFFIIKSLVISGKVVGEVYGPVGIAGLVGDAARLGFLYVMQLTASLSVIIAVINFLPLPALDGGRVLFLLIEALRGKPVNQRFEALVHNTGFALLMLLVLFVTFNDVSRLTAGFGGLFQSISRLF